MCLLGLSWWVVIDQSQHIGYRGSQIFHLWMELIWISQVDLFWNVIAKKGVIAPCDTEDLLRVSIIIPLLCGGR